MKNRPFNPQLPVNQVGQLFVKLTAFSPVVVFLALALTGCKTLQFGRAGVVPDIMAAQTPGVAAGAGGSITGPANSGAATTQIAERRAAYFPPFPAPTQRVPPYTASENPLTVGAKETPLASIPATQPVQSTYERTETTFGRHQSATGIVKAAASMEGWSTFRWLALGALVVGLGGMLYSYNNEESGYMMVFMKVAGVGAFCLMASDNPWWLALLAIPIGFWAIQKWGLFKIL